MKYIKEFWEHSKSYYGQLKSNSDSFKNNVNLNTQNGYSEVGQWVLLSNKKKVFIETIEDTNFTGFDSNGKNINGNLKDVIRILMKNEV